MYFLANSTLVFAGGLVFSLGIALSVTIPIVPSIAVSLATVTADCFTLSQLSSFSPVVYEIISSVAELAAEPA